MFKGFSSLRDASLNWWTNCHHAITIFELSIYQGFVPPPLRSSWGADSQEMVFPGSKFQNFPGGRAPDFPRSLVPSALETFSMTNSFNWASFITARKCSHNSTIRYNRNELKYLNYLLPGNSSSLFSSNNWNVIFSPAKPTQELTTKKVSTTQQPTSKVAIKQSNWNWFAF